MDDKRVSKAGIKGRIGIRTGHTAAVIASVKEYLAQHPADYSEQVDSLLELIYMASTEYNSVETPELTAGIGKAEKELRSLPRLSYPDSRADLRAGQPQHSCVRLSGGGHHHHALRYVGTE